MTYQNKIKELLEKTKKSTAQEIIQCAYGEFGDRLVFATSLGEEDQVITDMISKIAPAIEIFTLDTGRLFQETYELLARTQKRYPMTFKIYYPETEAVEEMVQSYGINLF